MKMGPSPIPAVWTIERSDDYGRSFKPWRHFTALPQACKAHFGVQFNLPISRVDTVTCQSQRISEIENEEIVIDLIKGRPSYKSFALNEEMQNWTKATNIRLIFYKLQTFLGELVVKDSSVMRTQFYTLRDIVVSGRCLCHGHDNGCEFNEFLGEMECQCLHNTCGRHCETCCPGYHQYQWKSWTRASTTSYVGCQKCNCFEHANNCYYNATVEKEKLSLDMENNYRGGGVCINCLHNTEGINCQKCKNGFYRPPNVSPFDPYGCKKCLCNLAGSLKVSCNDTDGHCFCKKNVVGPICNSCDVNFWNFPNCIKCNCFSIGSVDQTCDLLTGSCQCKPGMSGLKCDVCQDLNNSIITENGCLVCHQCSLEHLNLGEAQVLLVNSSLNELTLSTPMDSWVHLRLRWIDDLVLKTRSYLTTMLKIFSKKIGWRPRIYESYIMKQTYDLNKSLVRLEDWTSKFSIDFEISSPKKLEKALMIKDSSRKILASSLHALSITKLSEDLIEGAVSNLANVIITYSNKKCADSCKMLVESTASHWHKQIFNLKETYANAYDKSYAEMNEVKLIESIAERLSFYSLQELIKLRKNKFSLKRITRLLLTNHLTFELISAKLRAVNLLFNPGYIFRLKDKISGIYQDIELFNEIDEIKDQYTNLRLSYKFKESKSVKHSRLFEKTFKELKTLACNATDNFETLKKLLVKLQKKTSELINSSNWTSKQFKFVGDVTKPFHSAIKDFKSIPNVVLESKNKLFIVRKFHYQVDKFIKYMYQQLTNLTIGKEEFSFSFDSNGWPNRGNVDDEDYPSSGYFQDGIDNVLGSKLTFRIQNGVSFWKEILNEEKAKSEWTQRAINDKAYELSSLPKIMTKSEIFWNDNEERMKYVVNEIFSLTQTHVDFEFTKNNVLNKSENIKTFSNTVQTNLMNMNAWYEKKINKLQDKCWDEQLRFAKTLTKINNNVQLISSMIKKVSDQEIRQLPILSTDKIFAIRNHIKKSRQFLSTFQTPLQFNSPSYVSIILPEITNSLITTFEFWIKIETSNALIFKIGDTQVSKTSISLYLKSQHLVVEIKNGNKLAITSKKADDLLIYGYWHFVEFKWIADAVTIFMGVGVSKSKQILKFETDSSNNREIAPIAYVGGLPIDTFFLYFIGCLGGLKINGFTVDMYNWNSVKGHVQSCNSLPSDKAKVLPTLSFNGNGGLSIEPPLNSFGVLPEMEFFLRTVQSNSVLVFITDQTQEEQLIVKLIDGRITLVFETTNQLKNVEVVSAKKYNDGKLHHVKLTPIRKELITGLKLSVDDLDRINGVLYNPNTKKTVISLGTISSKMWRDSEDHNFIGCLIGLKINGQRLTQMSRSNNRFDYLMAMCPTVMGRCMCLPENLTRAISVKPLGFRITKLNLLFSFGSKPLSPGTTILYYSSSPYTSIEIYATSRTNLNVRYELGYPSKLKILNQRLIIVKNSSWHTIILKNQFFSNSSSSILFIDEHKVELPIDLFSDIRFSAQNILHLGGKPLVIRDGHASHYHSTCYRDFLLNDEWLDFSNYANDNNLELC